MALEGHRQHALVVIVTDGYGLRLSSEAALTRSTSDVLLRALSEWPRLAFVDVSGGEHTLATRVQTYGLTCIAPEDIPAFLGAGSLRAISQRQAGSPLLDDLKVWAAATALSAEPVTDEAAFALRDHLALPLSPWGWREISHAAEGFGGMVNWPDEQRTELLNWLMQCFCRDGRVEKGSPLDKALDFWLARYREESDARHSHESALSPWQLTEAQQRRELDMAFLEMWRCPAHAVQTLYRLKPNFEDEISERLSRLAAWDERQTHRSDAIVMPWRRETLSAPTRWMLSRLKFGRDTSEQTGRLQTSRALGLACGLCGGMAVVAFGLFASEWVRRDEPIIKPELPAAVEQVVIQSTHRAGLKAYDLVIGTPKSLRVKGIRADTTVNATWRWRLQDNVEPYGQSELWHAGTLAQPIRACDSSWPRRSLVAIEAPPDAIPARQLAIRLLDRGSADRVLLGEDWAQHLDHLLQVDATYTIGDQLIIIQAPDARPPKIAFQGHWGVVRSDDFAALAKTLEFEGMKALSEDWNTQPNVQLQLWGGPNKQTDNMTGITFVELCSGTFTMGSNYLPPKKENEKYYADEKPQHPVTISTFAISETEITRAQFEKAIGDDGSLPAGDLTWHDAKKYCEQFGFELPTEAEWEYAARGGSATSWSFGDDEKQLGDYAWFRDNRTAFIHPVGKKLPNPLGLFDMHGNALEWVEDCYDATAYAKRESPPFHANPQNDKSCETRVLRGGWSFDFPEYLRSARRVRDEPENSVELIGFRCVRRPRR